MNGPGQDGSGRGQRQRRRDAMGPRCGAQGSRQSGKSRGTRTTTRMLIAAGTYVAQDLRDADGLLRPALRRAALSLALGSRFQARRLGSAYLRLDPPPRAMELTATSAPEVVERVEPERVE